MNSIVEFLNTGGGRLWHFAGPMLLQSSLLIAAMFALDRLFRRKIRAAIRYAAWLIVLVKLLVPPTLAFPTGAAWWLRHSESKPLALQSQTTVVVHYGPMIAPPVFPKLQPITPLKISLSASGWVFLVWGIVSVGLFGWMLSRWFQVKRAVRRATSPAENFYELLDETRRACRLKNGVRLRWTENAMSPAVCGLFRPVILLPRALTEKLATAQLRAVLLHEMIHLKRRDVWVNCAQALIQIVYWWHPLLWFANARIRRVREEAVDDAVMLALRDDSETYAPTLLEVAKLALNRPLASLGLVGILESRNALRQRIERLIHFPAPRKAGLSVMSLMGLAAFTAVALPMGQAPEKSGKPELAQSQETIAQIASSDLNSNAESNSLPGHVIRTNPGRKSIMHKLDTIRLKNLSFDSTPLAEVIRDLNRVIKKSDPENGGLIRSRTSSTGQTTIDPATGLPLPGSAAPFDINTVPITIRPALTNIRLADALDAIVKSADKPIKYSITDFGIIFSQRGPEVPEFHIRTFNVDTNRFLSVVKKQTGPIKSNSLQDIQLAIVQYLSTNGLDFKPATGKNIFFNLNEGKLWVRATKDELEKIEKLLDSSGSIEKNPKNAATGTTKDEAASLVHDGKVLYEAGKLNESRAKFESALSIDPKNPAALYYLSLVTHSLQEKERVKSELQKQSQHAPPEVDVQAKFVEVSKDLLAKLQSFPSMTTSKDDQIRILMMTPVQARSIMKALESSSENDLLAVGEVTTLSARQAEIQIEGTQPFPTNSYSEKIENPKKTYSTGTNVLDVFPVVADDGRTIQLRLAVSAVEFLGLADPGPFKIGDSSKIHYQNPIPRYRIHEMKANVTVRDGQTVVLFDNSAKISDSKTPDTKNKNVVVFVTTTLIDSAGNRIHSDAQ